MKKILFPLLFLGIISAYTQPNTEVYLADISLPDDNLELNNFRNLSKNDGYDNQPSFYEEEVLLFAATREGQTDVMRYTLHTGKRDYLTQTPKGSEYSPLRIPGSTDFSSIRLDTDGTQLLYRYPVSGGTPQVLLRDIKVGYQLWFDQNLLIATVLVEDRMDLIVNNLKDSSSRTFQKDVGRSLHRIPNTEQISFLSKEEQPWVIKSMDPISGATAEIIRMPENEEDYCWLPDGSLLVGKGFSLLRYHPDKDQDWMLAYDLKEQHITNISRLAISPEGNRLALVAEFAPEALAQQQLDAYNARDIEAFLIPYAQDVKLYRFNGELIAEGKAALRERYGSFFEATPDLFCELKYRTVIGNKVIDEEYVRINGNYISALAIYEIENGKIAKVTFVQ